MSFNSRFTSSGIFKLSVIATTVAAASAAFAQDEHTGLEEIVVTAEKRASTVQDIVTPSHEVSVLARSRSGLALICCNNLFGLASCLTSRGILISFFLAYVSFRKGLSIGVLNAVFIKKKKPISVAHVALAPLKKHLLRCLYTI